MVQPRGGQAADTPGDAFVQGDLVRFRSASGVRHGGRRPSLPIEDPDGNKDTGTIEVQVRPPDTENREPDDLHLEARVFAGGEVVIPGSVGGRRPGW